MNASVSHMKSFAPIFAFGVAIIVAGCNEVPEVYFPDYQAVVASGAIERGWIPAWVLPESAVQIHEKHNIDTNQMMLAFRYTSSERFALTGCEVVEPRKPKDPPFSVEWWPSDVPATPWATHRHGFWECEDGKAYFAFSNSLGEAFYWRP